MAIPIYIDLPILPTSSIYLEGDIKTRQADAINQNIAAIRHCCPNFEINAWNALEVKRRAAALIQQFAIYNPFQLEAEYDETTVRLCLEQLLTAASNFPAWILQ
jgi:hypothetical protein